MSSLTSKDVLRLARLANIILSKPEVTSLKEELSEVVDYFEKLKKVNTENIKPTSQTTGLQDVLRDDEVDTSLILPREDALSGTEKTHNGYFVVTQVVDKDK